MYHTILLAVALQHWERYSAHALAARDVAATLARGEARPLHVLSVYNYDTIGTTGLPPDPTLLPPAAALRHQEGLIQHTDELMVRKMDDYIAPLKQAGVEVAPIVRRGQPRTEIVQTAAQLKADVLIMGSHSKRGLLDISLGGTAQQISRQAPCTVVLVSPKHAG